jgi:hypothetical protein
MKPIGVIIAVVVAVAAAFTAGRMSAKYQPLEGEQAYLRCIENVALAYRFKVRAEFLKAEREWEDKRSPYRWPYHAAVFRTFERPDFEGYMAQVAPMRVDFPAYEAQRIECEAAARRW